MAVFNSRRKDIGMKGEKRWGRERVCVCVKKRREDGFRVIGEMCEVNGWEEKECNILEYLKKNKLELYLILQCYCGLNFKCR